MVRRRGVVVWGGSVVLTGFFVWFGVNLWGVS